MSQHSAIGWTDTTWNPVTGCSHVSPGCVNCYAETLSLRFGRSTKSWTAQNAAENVKLHPERLDAPLRWREPRMVFVNSMSDLFHELVPFEYIDRVFAVMALSPRHTFQVLTKRVERMLEYLKGLTIDRLTQTAYGLFDEKHPHARSERLVPMFYGKTFDWWRAFGIEEARRVGLPIPNVWTGISAEDQRRADERIPLLLETPSAVRFISFEPLLERVEWAQYARTGKLHWAITGGESGPNYRPSEVEWTASIVATCDQYGIAPFVKQDSGPRPGKQGRLSDALWSRKEYPVGGVRHGLPMSPRNRRCKNRAPHEAHTWRGLNTRGDGYQCPGVRQVLDLMQALKDALAAEKIAPPKRPDLLDELHESIRETELGVGRPGPGHPR